MGEFQNTNYPDLFSETARNFRPALGHFSVWLSGCRSIHCSCAGCIRKSPKAMPLSPLESAKQAFFSLLLRLGRSHAVPLQISRESPDPELLKAYRRISKKVHPDRGGSLAQSQNLNASKDAWEEARKKSKCPGRPAQQNTEVHSGPLVVASRRGFRIQSVAVLLTYQGFKDCAQWRRFLSFVSGRLRQWKAKYWTATLETNAEQGLHGHLMLQFHSQVEALVSKFAFETVTPNAQTNDLLGDGLCKKKLQQSIDRGLGGKFQPTGGLT